MIIGGGAIAAGAAPLLRRLAAERRVGMLNTCAAKGLFAWNDPAHLGTIGLQADDLQLGGVAQREVLLVGVPDRELSRVWLDSVAARWREISATELGALLATNDEATPRPPLYAALASVCGPLYDSVQLPLNPARAAADLAAWLPVGGVVRAGYDLAGFWLGRTFPTRELGSVQFDGAPGVAAATVAVVWGRPDGSTHEVHGAVVEYWSPDGPAHPPQERLHRLQDAVAGRRRAALWLGVDGSTVDAFVAVAGAVLWK